MAEEYDYIIVGAGSAGCILANRLSAERDVTVCLLEAGPPDRNPFIHIPAGFIKTLVDSRINWMFTTEPSEHTGGRSIPVPRGKTLGGSSAINGHIYNRGQPDDFNGWAQLGNRGWGYADVLPYFKRTESRVGEADDTFRGREGPVKVENIPYRHPLCDRLIEGAAELGIPHNPDYNGAIQEGISYVQRTAYRGRRVSTATAYLHPVSYRKNLSVVTNAQVKRIMLKDGQANSVEVMRGRTQGETSVFKARKEIILSAGAVGSPHILQVSGIGAPSLLNTIGVNVCHALEGVGENLQDHWAPRLSARVKGIETLNERATGIRFAAEVVKYFLGAQSILNLSASLVYGFWHSEPAAKSNDLQFIFTPASFKDGQHGLFDSHPGYTIAAWRHRPESRGYVRANSANVLEAPRINPNYLSEESDRRATLNAVKLARSLMQTQAMAPFHAGEVYPGDDVQTDDELMDAARRWGSTTYHLMGTCRMGPKSDPSAVVDDELRVHGIDGLRVVDASIMPKMISANLNAATMMIAEKGA
ncbi:MAG: GMC family oxidoreductase, partial [Rhodospirillaceae bacterium]